MRFLSVETARANDARMAAGRGVPGRVLMERAGAAVARWAGTLCKARGGRSVLLAAGRGQNAGDVFVAARHLAQKGFQVSVKMVCGPGGLRDDALDAFESMGEGVPCAIWDEPEAWRGMGLASAPAPDVVVDGLLGTGAKDAPDALLAAAIGFVNTLGRHALVLSVDVPSGMLADTGDTPGACVRADVTLAVAAPKRGFAREAARPLLGHVAVADIGVPQDWQESDVAMRMACAPSLSALIPPREHDAHKGNFGHVLVLGGSEEYTGAPVLAALAALAAGAGKVTLAAPAASRAACAATHPEIMALAMDAEIPWDKFQALVLGPGLGATDTGYSIASRVMRAAPEKLPMVVDADALRVLYGMHFPHPSRVVMTPHAGEAAPLLGQTIPQLNKKRAASAATLASKFKCTAVLKGAGTLVAQPNAMLSLNMTGNPGMAVAGCGDMLAGIAGALLARGIAPRDAARLAAWLHGAAGDFAAWRHGQEGLLAGDILRAMPDAFSLLRREGAASFNEDTPPAPETPAPQETPAQ